MRNSKLFSWLALGFGAALFAAVAWSRLAAPPGPRWQPELAGRAVGELPVVDAAGDPVEVVHPAVIYFFEANCPPCAPAARRLGSFAAGAGPDALPVYAITNSSAFSEDSARALPPPIRFVRLRRSTPELGFVTELPLFVRTDARGRIALARVGSVDEDALRILADPREASTAER